MKNLEKFVAMYGDEEEEENAKKRHKPADFEQLFRGNCDDDFVLGMKFDKRGIVLCTGNIRSDVVSDIQVFTDPLAHTACR